MSKGKFPMGLFSDFENIDIAIGKFEAEAKKIKEWRQILNELSWRAKDRVFINELESIGPKGLAELKALDSLSSKDLEKYLFLYHESKKLAKKQWLSMMGKDEEWLSMVEGGDDMDEEKEKVYVGIKGHSSDADVDNGVQRLDVSFGVKVHSAEFAQFQVDFLKDLQAFLNERK